jgi:hypothetical protein
LLSGESVITTLARVQRILSFLLLWFLPVAALADGMVVPTIAYPAKITIPDQRALICFTNGTERLVIETRFTGAGTNFAWVVPLPSQPVIEEATTGLFPTLQYLFRPQIIHDVPRHYVWILSVFGLVFLIRFLLKHASVGFAIALFLLLFLVAALLLPATSTAGMKGMKAISSEQVSILDRKLVGVFETTTIASHDAKALQTWLTENGYSVPTNSEPVIAGYVEDGWVFAAIKVRRDTAAADTSTPNPLSFIFKTDKPVYPMRLTGLNGQPLSVELYVFGPARAEAAHFAVERCTRPNYPQTPPADFLSWNWSRMSPEIPNIVHPLLRKWANGLPVATKLTATLVPAEMRQDVWFEWTPFWEKKNHLFSQQGALTTALNWGTELFGVGFFAACLFAIVRQVPKTKLPPFTGIMALAGISLACLVYLALPKIEVRTAKISFGVEHTSLFLLGECLSDPNPITHTEISAEARHLLDNPTNDVEWSKFAGEHVKNMDNYLLGGRIHEEDSPGNFTFRENSDRIEIITYDAQGAEHILPGELSLPLKR